MRKSEKSARKSGRRSLKKRRKSYRVQRPQTIFTVYSKHPEPANPFDVNRLQHPQPTHRFLANSFAEVEQKMKTRHPELTVITISREGEVES